jgi:hypothetical protein
MKGLYKIDNGKLIFEKDEITLSNGEKLSVNECEHTMIEIEGWRWFADTEEAKEFFNNKNKI